MPELPQPVLTVQLVPLMHVPAPSREWVQFRSPLLAEVGPALTSDCRLAFTCAGASGRNVTIGQGGVSTARTLAS